MDNGPMIHPMTAISWISRVQWAACFTRHRSRFLSHLSRPTLAPHRLHMVLRHRAHGGTDGGLTWVFAKQKIIFISLEFHRFGWNWKMTWATRLICFHYLFFIAPFHINFVNTISKKKNIGKEYHLSWKRWTDLMENNKFPIKKTVIY